MPNDSFTLDITHVQVPRGNGRRKLGTLDYVNLIERKHSIIEIKNKEELCCARALVTAKARHEKEHSDEAFQDYCYIKSERLLQERLAWKLYENACVQVGPCGLQKIAKFQAVLEDYQIIISADRDNVVVFQGEACEKQLILLLHNEHFDVITSLTGYFGKLFLCEMYESIQYRGFQTINVKNLNPREAWMW